LFFRLIQGHDDGWDGGERRGRGGEYRARNAVGYRERWGVGKGWWKGTGRGQGGVNVETATNIFLADIFYSSLSYLPPIATFTYSVTSLVDFEAVRRNTMQFPFGGRYI
jgi:hypothetical protein